MCRKTLLLVLVIWLSAGTALGAPTSITVVNYSFEIPDNGQKLDISVGTPGVVTGWARTDPTTSAGREFGHSPTNGSATGFMGLNAEIYNLTDFLLMEGDTFQLIFDAESTWHGDNLAAQLYYKNDAGNRVVFATTNIDLWGKTDNVMATYTLDSNAVGLAARDHKVGIQFKQTRVKSTDNNLWCGLDYIRLSITTSLMRAQTPYPAYESFYTGDSVTLTWAPGPDAGTVDNYKVYISDKWADVNSGALAADKGTRDVNNCDVGGLVKGLIYYWRIDTVSGANTYRGNIWKFTTKPTTAYDPVPNTGAQYVAISPVISWTAGSGAVLGHNVYFSDNLAAVTTAATGSIAVPFRANPGVADTNWAPSESGLTPLALSKTYYWRIDEVESASKIYKGTVWSFTTVPVPGLGSIMCQLYTGIPGGTVADLTNNANYPDNPSSTEYLTSFEAPHRAFVEYGSRVHGYLYIRNTGDYTFWIASGENSQLWLSTDDDPGNASIIARVEGGDGYTDPRQWNKYPDIQQSAPKHLEAGNLYYIMVLHKKGWGYDNLAVAWQGPDQPNPPVNGEGGAIIPGISLIPFDPSKQVWAYKPNPANNATNIEDLTPTLTWKPGVKAVKHDVYFSDNFSDVNSATTSSSPTIYKGRIDPNKYDITTDLNWGQTYYWRIDEVNGTNMWRGNIWHFTTRNYLVVDNFESYTNSDPNIIFKIWKDGVGYSPGNGTGSQVGYRDPNYAELIIVHAGTQSMPVDYNNTKTPYYSEATRTFDTPQNWAVSGSNILKALSLWFRGYPASVGSFVTSGGTYTITASGADIWNVPDLRHPSRFHDEFHYAYKEITAADAENLVTIIAKVESITNTHASAKAGVMIRDSLDPNSTHGLMDVMYSAGDEFLWRLDTSGASDANVTSGITAPYWVKLVLDATPGRGNLRAYHSSDGSNWTQVGTVQQISTMTLPRSTPLYVGLAVTAHNASATCTAKFSNVTITAGGTPGAWKHRDIGIKSNVPALLYVTLQDSNLNTAKVTYTDANAVTDVNAVLNTAWQQWDIALSAFAGVDRTKIKKITIGVGSGSADGTGTIYVDDVRLYISRCVPDRLRSAADFTGTDCIVDYQDLQILTNNWLISEYQVTPVAPSNANLVAYYMFENNYNDSSVNGNNGEPNGSTIVNDPTRGLVASFEPNACVNTNKSMLNDLSAFTLAGWVSAGNPDASRVGLFGQNDCIEFGFDMGDIHVWADANVSGGMGIRTAWTYANDTWHHVAAVGDGSGLKLYVDGIVVITGGSATTNYGNSTYEFNIGGGGIFDSSGNWFSGKIDEVRVYGRALSPGEVAYLASKTEPFTQPLYLLLTPQDSAIDLYNDGTIDLRDYAGLADTWLEKLLWP